MTNLETWESFVIPEDHILPKLRQLVASGCDLLTYAFRVHRDRLGRNNSKKWENANEKIFYGLMFHFYSTFKENRGHNYQINSIIRNINHWKLATDIKLWRSFCGRTHSVPTEKIAAFAAEIQTLENIVNKNQVL